MPKLSTIALLALTATATASCATTANMADIRKRCHEIASGQPGSDQQRLEAYGDCVRGKGKKTEDIRAVQAPKKIKLPPVKKAEALPPEASFVPTLPEHRKWINVHDLPKDNQSLYLLLFMANPDNEFQSDDFIGAAGKHVGYKNPYWHTELMYWDLNGGAGSNGEWKVVGCRPNTCTTNMPLKDLMNQMPGYTVDVRRFELPEGGWEGSLSNAQWSWIRQGWQGKPYDLLGTNPEGSHCADGSAAFLEMAGIAQDVRPMTKATLKAKGGDAFLKSWGISIEVDKFIQKDLLFPGALEDEGGYVGSFHTFFSG